MKLFKLEEGQYVEATEMDIREAHIQKSDLIGIFWNRQDVESIAKELGGELGGFTEDDIVYAMDILENSHDANIGISWDVIRDALTSI